jgi:hypothetical protein
MGDSPMRVALVFSKSNIAKLGESLWQINLHSLSCSEYAPVIALIGATTTPLLPVV